MPQHDMEITNADANSGLAVRAAINAALQALVTNNEGATEPPNPYKFMWWPDTTTGLLKMRNAANSAWITVGTLASAYLGLAALAANNEFTATQKLKGDALLWRFLDTGGSGKEWGLRSDGGNLEVVENTGTEGSPTWTVRKTFYSGVIDSNVKGADIASAATTDIGAATGNYIDITGTTTITGLGTIQAGTYRICRFTGSLILTHNATSLILPGGANITTAAGDVAMFVSLGSGNWRCVAYTKADGTPVVTPASIPTGAIIPWPTGSVPSGYLECDGSAISRTTYASLFALISDDYGAGDGSTTFNLPDYRGRFLRGWAHGQSTDPDRASRTNRGDGVTGDYVGTKQAGQVEAHTHGSSGSHSHVTSNYNTGGGGYFGAGTSTPYSTGTLGDSGAHQHTSVGGNENRPININVMYVIKY